MRERQRKAAALEWEIAKLQFKIWLRRQASEGFGSGLSFRAGKISPVVLLSFNLTCTSIAIAIFLIDSNSKLYVLGVLGVFLALTACVELVFVGDKDNNWAKRYSAFVALAQTTFAFVALVSLLLWLVLQV